MVLDALRSWSLRTVDDKRPVLNIRRSGDRFLHGLGAWLVSELIEE
jgi:hypothetical protein